MKCRMTNRFCRAPYFPSLASHPELVRKQEVGWVFGKPLVKSYWCRLLITEPLSVSWKSTPLLRHVSISAGTKKIKHGDISPRTNRTISGRTLAVAGSNQMNQYSRGRRSVCYCGNSFQVNFKSRVLVKAFPPKHTHPSQLHLHTHTSSRQYKFYAIVNS